MSIKNNKFKILAISSPDGLKYMPQSFLIEENIQLDKAKLMDMVMIFSKDTLEIRCNGYNILDYNYVWIQATGHFRDVAHIFSMYLDINHIPHSRTDFDASKLVDLFNLSKNNISIPKTFYCATKRLVDNVNLIEETITYPFIIKPTLGSWGADMHLIKTRKDLESIFPTLKPYKKYVCQEFIPNLFDYRILIGNDVILSGERRVRQNDSFRNNVHLGATEEFMDVNDIPQNIQNLSLKVSKICDIKWTGIDIIKDSETGQDYVLELNRCPGLTKDSAEIEGAKIFIKSIRSEFNKKNTSNINSLAEVSIEN